MPRKTITITSPTPPATAREALHEILRTWAPAAGATGFEGLVADALAGFTLRSTLLHLPTWATTMTRL